MTSDEVRAAFDDPLFVEKLARAYVRTKSLSAAAAEMGIAPSTIDQVFAEEPALEDRFNDKVLEVGEREAVRVNAAALPALLNKLYKLTIDVDEVEPRIVVQACSAHLQFYLRTRSLKKPQEEDDIDKLYKMVQNGDKQQEDS